MTTFTRAGSGWSPGRQVFEQPVKDESEDCRRLLKRTIEDASIPPSKRRKPDSPTPAFKPQNSTNALISKLEDAPPGWDFHDRDVNEKYILCLSKKRKRKVADPPFVVILMG